MSSEIGQTESVHADSDADNSVQDSKKSKIYNLLLPFNLQNYVDEVPLDWHRGQYDRQIPLSHNGYILCFLLFYHNAFVDVELQEMFIDSFSEWEDEDWKTAHRVFTLAMRKTLRS